MQKEEIDRRSCLARTDPEIFRALQGELEREQNTLVLIASENYASQAVLEATCSQMTNKYAEGYPRARYYGGCEWVDIAESLAIERAQKLFGADHANVQPHSGSQANQAVYLATLSPGDTILGMNLSHGGHLTHGSAVNISGKFFHPVFYGVDEKNQRIDFDQVRDLAREHRPKLIVSGASAYPRTIDFRIFREIADEVGALLLADMAHISGLVAAGLHPDPVPLCEYVSTSTHKTLRGPRGGMVLCRKEFAKKLDSAVFPGLQGGPLMHIIAAKAVALQEALTPQFKEYMRQVLVNCRVLAEELMNRGYTLVSGGTDNHLLLVDLRSRKMTGKEAAEALGKAGITVNKNVIPFDPEKPTITSGIRIGTPAVTTRGLKEGEMRLIAEFIGRALEHRNEEKVLEAIRQEVLQICGKFPVYPFLAA